MNHHKPDPDKKINLTIDGVPITVPEGTRILEAAEKAGSRIPTLCEFQGLGKRAVCRICVVECDGRSKLVPACTGEVWEGVNIVTGSPHILSVRKTIVELLLSNHPQECLVCIRNGKCELQKLAADLGIREKPFRRDSAEKRKPEIAGGVFVRNMDKCVKCGRCVEVCQELQTVRAVNTGFRSINYEICAPFNEALGEGPCIYCGQCAEVCPVGALYEHDQTALVREALDNNKDQLVTQITPSTGRVLDGEFGLQEGTVTSGKMVTALKLIGFSKVYDAGITAKMNIKEMAEELSARINNKTSAKPLPMIAACSPALNNFVKEFYPDLLDHLYTGKNPGETFVSLVKTGYEASKIRYVSIMPCMAKKLEARTQDVYAALTTQELTRMFHLAGIEFNGLPETPFDRFIQDSQEEEKSAGHSDIGTIISSIYQTYTGGFSSSPAFEETQGHNGIKETELAVQKTKIKILEVNGLANARAVMDSICKGECNAALVLVNICPVCRGVTR